MTRRKFLNILFILVFITHIFGGNTRAASAQPPIPPNNGRPERPELLTQADREAAAVRAEEDGFVLKDMGTTDMPMPGAAPQYFSVPNYANSPLPGNSVVYWNAIAQNVVQPMPMPGMPMMGGISMVTAFVYLSYVQAAVYDALVAIEGGYEPYNPAMGTADPTASRDAAVAAAAYNVLIHYLPDKEPMLTPLYTDALATIVDGPQKVAGIQIGQQAAAGIIALRTGDGLLAPDTYTILPPGPGIWEPTVMPGGTVVPPIDPWLAQFLPFTMQTPDQFRPGAPWALDSDQWATEMNTVKELGSATSTLRTLEQTNIAYFWTTNNVIQFNAAYRETALNHNLTLLDSARLLAMGNMVGTDSLIACFDSKYNYSFWRPITAIQRADTDGTDLTVADPTWAPLVMTPSHPEYVAGHSCYVSAQAEVFTEILGTSQIEIDLASLVTGQTRHYTTAADLRQEVNNARIWAGLHYPGSTALGEALGLSVAQYALANYFAPAPSTGVHAQYSGGIRKFVDTLPGLDKAGANNLGQYIPVAVADTTTYPGSDYYEIAVVEYEEQMHSDLPPTLLRGYVQLSTSVVPGDQVPLTAQDGSPILLPDGTQAIAVDEPHYLGPLIAATKGKPVRILFRNLLPTGTGGNLFIPVDTTVMGAGMGPLMDPEMEEADPQNPMCGMVPKPYECYTENRATLHLHGGISPWISDGTPHQWITPADENTPYPEGVSVQNVPDMPDPGPGAMTFFYTNQQSARLMFYHDHSWGITRLNVYAGEAAAYTITDPMEEKLITDGILPADQIPLVIQDKTFVPSAAQLAISDPLWDMSRWGGFGDLWLPHVYVPAQNPGDSSGVNQFGRWAYGPWFWPPTIGVDHGPIPNPYYDPSCDPDVQWCEPPLMPGTPFNSMGMEAFMDTPVVNGTLYPTLTVDPKAYRMRILNAANDRFFNLQFYVAIDANGNLCDPATNPSPAPESTGVVCTEVLLNPDEVLAALEDSTIFPTPDMTTSGPSWIQIGTEGGFLPAPAVIPAQPITWVNDPTVFNAGNVDLHSLLLGPAERADVVVDFSAFAGMTLILYNDAPAAFPARDPRYDYYTGNGDYRDTGGAPSTLPGYGPNTRTVMKIVVSDLNAEPAYDLNALNAAFGHHLDGEGNPAGVFEASQHPIIVGQGAYNSAYGTTFNQNGSLAGLAQIFDTSLTFATLSGNILTMPLQPKMIQDEMGEAFDQEYGRMSGNLGVESPNPQAGNQNMILYGFASPPTEIINGVELPPGVEVTPIASTDDGTQIWKITHNGVDTHPIHFHLFDVQLINRVGWDGIIRKPEANELGWKDTVRISPLEDTIVALRPIIPNIPWDLPNSIRLLDPSMPEGAILASSTMAEAAGLIPLAFDPTGEPIDIYNHYVNFGWEYVWHCHILSHEEMDMMRPIVVGVAPRTPSDLDLTPIGDENNLQIVLTWLDNSLNETSFIVQRATSEDGPWTDIASLPAPIAPSVGSATYTDLTASADTTYYYRVLAQNLIGDTWDYSDPNLNEGASFPTLTIDSEFSNTAIYIANQPAVPLAPTNLTAAMQPGPQVLLNWVDNATNETGFVIERGIDGGAFSVLASIGENTNTGNASFTDTTVQVGFTYQYRVAAENAVGLSPYSNIATTCTPISDIQGAGHISPMTGTLSQYVCGIVTAIKSDGFYLQDTLPDADPATSEALFVFTSTAPTVSLGDQVYVHGTVTEYRPDTTGLTITQLDNPGLAITLLSSGNSLPAPVVIGAAGRMLPTEVIDDDATNVETDGSFDADTDGIDFYESLEGMLVQVDNARVIAATNSFGEIAILPDNGLGSGLLSPRGAIVIRDADFNPERILMDDTIITNEPQVLTGQVFSAPIVGVIDYTLGNFKLFNTSALPAVTGSLMPEVTDLNRAADQITVATFNLEDLDGLDAQAKFDNHASQIVINLRSPDIIGLQEIQDNNGATDDGVVAANVTFQRLINAIQAAGGPTYDYRQINPEDNADGGAPGGNIRVGFLFRTDRGLSFVDRSGGTATNDTTAAWGATGVELSYSPGRVAPNDPAFTDSRKPLAGEFIFNGRKVIVVVNHLISKSGDDPLFGFTQPPVLHSEAQRIAQAEAVNAFVDSILGLDPQARVLVIGDLNDFQFSEPVEALKGGVTPVLTNLHDTLPASERYSYVFDGNSQAWDHVLASDQMIADGVTADVVHMNAEFLPANRYTDHDPMIALFTIPKVQVQFSLGNLSVSESITSVVITATLDSWAAVPVLVDFTTSDGSALAGVDYTATSGTLTFSPTETQQTFTVQIIFNPFRDSDRTILLSLSAAMNATLGLPNQLILTILNDLQFHQFFPVVQLQSP